MKTTLQIHKMTGAGNIFTIFDNRESVLTTQEIQSNSHQLSTAFGEKTEGIMAINSPKEDLTDFDVWFFNSDGSYGAMCGNGSRCAVEFAKSLGIVNEQQQIAFTMANSLYSATFTTKGVAVTMPDYIEFTKEVSVRVADKVYVGSYVNVGSDHFIVHKNQFGISDEEFWSYDFTEDAKQIRFSPGFEPRGVNVSIYMIGEDNVVQMRTYERGVEAETGACGTGAISVATVVNHFHIVDFPIEIVPTSQQRIWVDYQTDETKNSFILEGNALYTESKTIELP
ncbi:MAG: diaminopimelate epimerase [Candidatus Kapabacteria bacterium]|nr:diaminopimelate epimerase [Candidatus Kapabacteria bacterium]